MEAAIVSANIAFIYIDDINGGVKCYSGATRYYLIYYCSYSKII